MEKILDDIAWQQNEIGFHRFELAKGPAIAALLAQLVHYSRIDIDLEVHTVLVDEWKRLSPNERLTWYGVLQRDKARA